MAAVLHGEFLQNCIFEWILSSGESTCVTRQNFVKMAKQFWRYWNFLNFEMAVLCHLGFSKFQTFGSRLGSVNIDHCTKFHQNQSNCFGDITFNTFYRATAMLAQYMLSSFVCLSVTRQYCLQNAKHINTETMTHDTPGSLVFWCQRSQRNSNGVTTRGCQTQVKIGNFWQITCYNLKR